MRVVSGFLCAGAIAMTANAQQPVAPVKDVSQVLHGVTVPDPYRYMENVKGPEVQKWLIGQGEYARSTLDRIEIRDELLKRIEVLATATGDAVYGVVRMPKDQLFYFKRPKGERQFKLVMRMGLAGEEKVLVDPEVEAKRTGVPHAVNYFVPSWDNRYVAYGMSAGGSEDASLFVLEVATGKTIGKPIPRVPEGLVSWLPSSKALAYNQLKLKKSGEPETEHYMDSKVMLLTVGEPEEKAKAVFGPTVTKNLGLGRMDVAGLHFSPDSPWVVARTTDTTLPEGFLFAAKLADLGKPGTKWTKVAGYADKVTSIELKGNDLYFKTYINAPRNRVLKLDLNNPKLASATVVAEPPKDGVLESFTLNRNAVVASIREGTSIGVRLYAAGDTSGKPVAMPFPGAAAVHEDLARVSDDVLYTLSGWTQLPRTFNLRDGQSVETPLRAKADGPASVEIQVTELRAPSHDGVLIPMTVLHKKGLVLDGNNPTLLNGYGAYGFSDTAGFSPSRLAWLERGGVLALANIRGSGVYGNDWYKAGFKITKSNTWKDGVACAHYLIQQGYASPKTLAVMGTSAGGIFVGRSVTTAPQLFAAAIFDVGMMDTVRSEESANGITNISEFGTVKNPVEFAALLDMSTYHQIKDGTAYPAVMLVHGMNDPRVDVWQSGKAAARLQAASSSGKPVLLRLDLQAGHGMGSTANQRYSMSADIYSFLLWQMGRTTLK